MIEQDIEEGKKLATIAYITFIGLIYSMIKNLDKKNPFVAFHTRQMLGLILLLLFSNTTERYVNSLFGTVLWFGTFIYWIYGISNAIKGETKLVPFFGKLFQDWFANIGK